MNETKDILLIKTGSICGKMDLVLEIILNFPDEDLQTLKELALVSEKESPVFSKEWQVLLQKFVELKEQIHKIRKLEKITPFGFQTSVN